MERSGGVGEVGELPHRCKAYSSSEHPACPRRRREANQPRASEERAPPGGKPKTKSCALQGRSPGSNPMSQSLAKNLIHLTFSTKDREPSLAPDAREGLHRYMAGILADLDSPALAINSVADHAHLLLNLSKNQSLANVVMELKRGSSKWLKTQGPRFCQFYWQGGYGAFSIGQSGVGGVKSYISRQEEHHRVKTFQEEFRSFLKRHEIAFDEKYLWS